MSHFKAAISKDTYPLQTNVAPLQSEAIAKWLRFIVNSSLFIFCENSSNSVSVSLWHGLTNPGNKKIKDLYREYCFWSSYLTIRSSSQEICASSETCLNEEIKHIESTFEKVNNYPKYVITQLKREVKLKHTQNMNIERSTINQTTQNEQDKRHLLVLPYAGNKGEKILKSMNKFSTRNLPCNVKICTAYSETKLSSKFQLKD